MLLMQMQVIYLKTYLKEQIDVTKYVIKVYNQRMLLESFVIVMSQNEAILNNLKLSSCF